MYRKSPSLMETYDEFIKEKKAIYFLATNSSENINLQLFSEQLFEVLNPELSAAQFPDFHSAFKYLAESVKGISSV